MLPQNILDQFARIPTDTTFENKYYGVFNKILNNICFPEDTFFISPQYVLPDAIGIKPPVDSLVTYVVEVNTLPVFFFEIKPLLYVDYIPCRVDADAQMRARCRALCNLAPTPRLHGVSAMGQRLAFYCLDKTTGRVDPTYVAPSLDYVTDTVPKERWNTDVTMEEGYRRFMTVVNDVREMSAAL